MTGTHDAGFDALGERMGRATAARTTRRSFLARLGQVAVTVAGGSALVPVLAGPAHARVCGQSGVAPKCATFDCDATWGWCWYASGCCADGALKKICDCCAPNTPHPRGYCPAGTRVKCIVESCGADPRLQTVPIDHLSSSDPARLAAAICDRRFRGRVPAAVLGDAESPAFAAIAASVGRVVDGPVLLTPRTGLHDHAAQQLRRLEVEYVQLVGPRIATAVDAAVERLGIRVERVGADESIAGCAAEVAVWHRTLTGTRQALVLAGDVARNHPAAPAAYAHARRLPLLFGTGAGTRRALAEPRPAARAWVLTEDAAAASEVPGGEAITAGDPYAQARRVGEAALTAGVPAATVTLATERHPAAAAACMPAPLLLYQPGSMSGAFRWLLAYRGGIERVMPVGPLDSGARYDLQAVVNEFETHLLTGSAGQGLPVIPQPVSERPIGQARR
jgi:hypothetical protein